MKRNETFKNGKILMSDQKEIGCKTKFTKIQDAIVYL